MSGYGYPGQGGYPGGGGGYPGSSGGYPSGGSGGYPGSGYPGTAPPHQGGYPGGAPPPQGYPGSAPPPGGYPGSAPPPGGYPGSAPPPQQGGYGGGYGGAPYGQPQVDPNVASWFRAVDQDNSGQITAAELKRALVNGNWSNFSEEACKLMIDMFDKNNTGSIDIYEFGDLFNYINQWKSLFESIDRDRSGYIEFGELSQDLYDQNSSGTIDLSEFQQLFDYINQWKAVFESYDTDRSGRIEQNELNQAFSQMGYRFSPTFVQNLLTKFDPRTRRLTLDNFIISCVQIKRLTDSFRTRDKEMRGTASLAYEDFVGLALGCHR